MTPNHADCEYLLTEKFQTKNHAIFNFFPKYLQNQNIPQKHENLIFSFRKYLKTSKSPWKTYRLSKFHLSEFHFFLVLVFSNGEVQRRTVHQMVALSQKPPPQPQ